jgi:hypothetical protein
MWHYWELVAVVNDGGKQTLQLRDSGEDQGYRPAVGMLRGLKAAALALRGHVDGTVYYMPDQPATAEGLVELLQPEVAMPEWRDAVQILDETGGWRIDVVEPGVIERHLR